MAPACILALERKRQANACSLLASKYYLLGELQANERTCLKKQCGRHMSYDTQGSSGLPTHLHKHMDVPLLHISFAVIKYHEKSSLVEKGVYFSIQFQL